MAQRLLPRFGAATRAAAAESYRGISNMKQVFKLGWWWMPFSMMGVVVDGCSDGGSTGAGPSGGGTHGGSAGSGGSGHAGGTAGNGGSGAAGGTQSAGGSLATGGADGGAGWGGNGGSGVIASGGTHGSGGSVASGGSGSGGSAAGGSTAGGNGGSESSDGGTAAGGAGGEGGAQSEACDCVDVALSWGKLGALVASYDTSSITGCDSFEYVRHAPLGPGPDIECATDLSDCSGAITVRDLAEALEDPDVLAAQAVAPVGYGRKYPSGLWYRIYIDGVFIQIGEPCGDWTNCTDAPLGVLALKELLDGLTATQVAREPCRSIFDL